MMHKTIFDKISCSQTVSLSRQ